MVETKKHEFKKIKTIHKLLLTRTTGSRSRIRDGWCNGYKKKAQSTELKLISRMFINLSSQVCAFLC